MATLHVLRLQDSLIIPLGSSHLPNGQFYEPGLSNSWTNSAHHSLAPSTDSSDSYYMGSQGDVYRELNEHAQYPGKGQSALGVAGHQYQLSYELALDNILTPFAPPAPIISPLARSTNMSQR